MFHPNAMATRPLLFVRKLITQRMAGAREGLSPTGRGGETALQRQRGVRTFLLLIPSYRGLPAEYEPPGAESGRSVIIGGSLQTISKTWTFSNQNPANFPLPPPLSSKNGSGDMEWQLG